MQFRVYKSKIIHIKQNLELIHLVGLVLIVEAGRFDKFLIHESKLAKEIYVSICLKIVITLNAYKIVFFFIIEKQKIWCLSFSTNIDLVVISNANKATK